MSLAAGTQVNPRLLKIITPNLRNEGETIPGPGGLMSNLRQHSEVPSGPREGEVQVTMK
jgi:hypothetical protein